MNIANLLEEKKNKLGSKTAIIFREENIAFSELRDNVFRVAGGLKGLGLKKGDKIALYLPNCPEYIYAYLASWCLGLTVVPLDFMLTEEELVSCLSHSESKVLIMRMKSGISLAVLRDKIPTLKEVVDIGQAKDALTLKELLFKNPPEKPSVEIKDNDYAIIFYTSGTTGKPKGVLINYLQLSAPPKSMDFFVGGIKEDDFTLCALPFSHLGGLIYIQNNIFHGLSVVLMERFVPLEFLKNIERYKITCFWIVPSMYYAFLQLKEFESINLTSLRWIVTFGASSSPDALRRFHKYCPKAHLLNGWGLTETNAPTTVLAMGSSKIESVGRPAPWIEVKIFNEEDQRMDIGDVGEIAVKSWVVTDGYYEDGHLTKDTIRNGWFYTGDLGRFDSEGNLYIVGRKKEMIKVAGEIVFEPEVESAIYKHPDILEAAVVGIQDKLRGEVPKAYIVLKEGRVLSEEELRYFLRQHLAHFKIPHQFEFLDSLPKNRTGKIDKERLRR